MNADILCLQEIELADFENDFGQMCEAMEYDYNRHQVNKKRTSPIGNVTLWKKNKIKSIKFVEKSCSLINMMQIGEQGLTFQVINVHLKAGLTSGEKERHSQLKSILKEKMEPVIICGDFNDELNENGLLYPLLNEFTLYPRQKTCTVFDKNFSFDHVVNKGLNIKVDDCNEFELIPNEFYPSDHMELKFNIFY